MPTARCKSASPTKHTAFALSTAQPSRRRGAWRPPPVYLADGKTVYQDYVRPPPGHAGFALNTRRAEELDDWPPPLDADGEAPEDAPEMYMAYIGSDVAPLGLQTTHSHLPGAPHRAAATLGTGHAIHKGMYLRETARRASVLAQLARSPIEPHLAVNMRVLDFVQDLFLNQAPNNRALTKTIEQCLDCLGYKLPNQESLRRQFGNTLEYYTILRHWTDQAMDDILQSVREEMCKEEEHCERPSTPTPSPHRGAEESPRKRRGRELESSPPSSPTKRTQALSSSPTPVFMPPSSSPGPSPEQSSSPGPYSPIAESSGTAGPIYPFLTPQDRV
ncbi:unnamed protein product [Mycena citricolor]|uniref:Uncharacterized protein n=1 Tax=Mycena citricolor TaxID=2018698 RepID=A0AAD2JXZ7_9AGAR|nr:unnamed protein product [Mycena citricolor]